MFTNIPEVKLGIIAVGFLVALAAPKGAQCR